MIGLLQRVTHASVKIDGEIIASINTGLAVLVGVEKSDTEENAKRLTEKIIAYRIFPDESDKMNLGLSEINGELLLVPQFTLPANTQKGLRPSFSNAAPPELGQKLFDALVKNAKRQLNIVETGKFGANMQVSLTNDGPVTFWIQV